MHGSGTTNPSKFFWELGDLMECRSKEPVHLTYRAVGSSTGQKEFVGPDDKDIGYDFHEQDFGAGDIPMTQSYFDTMKGQNRDMVHVPITVGAIGVFHSVPESDLAQPLHLDACTLGLIYEGEIERWDDPRILALNPGMTASSPIYVAHRVKGSSSTSGFTEYLTKKNATCWTRGGHKVFGPDAELHPQGDWPTGIGKEGSGGMSTYIKERSYAIGYIDWGHGRAAGLSEIALLNHDKAYVKATKEGIEAAANQALELGDVYKRPDESFAGVNLYDIQGEKTYPIVLTTYIYLAKDYTSWPADTAAATKAFVEMVISPDGQKIAEENGFVEMPSALVNLAKQAIQMVQWPDDMVPFTFETEDGTAFTPAKTQKELGMQPRVISAKRTCYGDYERKQMLVKVNELNSDSFASSSSLNDVQQSLADGLSTRDARISALEAQLEDNDDEDDQTATFAKAGLALGIIGFICGVMALAVALTKKHATVARPSIYTPGAAVEMNKPDDV
uniref:PBP domain-containing protein n=1 Tax=Emiliania huxleyi TaxID=2903 RepID=A0A7S3X0H1_EMIHU